MGLQTATMAARLCRLRSDLDLGLPSACEAEGGLGTDAPSREPPWGWG